MNDNFNVYGYTVAQTLVQVLKQAGDNLTRDNIMKQAASLDMTLPMLLPGVNIKTGPDDFYPIEREQLMKFNGQGIGRFHQIPAASENPGSAAKTSSIGAMKALRPS